MNHIVILIPPKAFLYSSDLLSLVTVRDTHTYTYSPCPEWLAVEFTYCNMNIEHICKVTTGFYMAKLNKIGYRVCSSGFSDVYETIQNPEFQNPAIGGI